ncbi:F0F1 ATP synthase subunit B, partial [Streptomyces sp. DT225]
SQNFIKHTTNHSGKLVNDTLEDHARQSGTVDRFLDELEAKAEAVR